VRIIGDRRSKEGAKISSIGQKAAGPDIVVKLRGRAEKTLGGQREGEGFLHVQERKCTKTVESGYAKFIHLVLQCPAAGFEQLGRARLDAVRAPECF